jgi:hypothetical protein
LDVSRSGGVLAVDEYIARLNIQHFRDLLAKEKDEAKRRTILRLLAEEEAKLAAFEARPKGTPTGKPEKR